MSDLADFAEARLRAEAYLNDSLQAQGVITPHERKLARDVLALHAAWEAATAERDALWEQKRSQGGLADTVERLRERNEDIRSSLAENVRLRDLYNDRADAAEAERDRLAGHVTALREGLSAGNAGLALARRIMSEHGLGDARNDRISEYQTIIREALAGLGEPCEGTDPCCAPVQIAPNTYVGCALPPGHHGRHQPRGAAAC